MNPHGNPPFHMQHQPPNLVPMQQILPPNHSNFYPNNGQGIQPQSALNSGGNMARMGGNMGMAHAPFQPSFGVSPPQLNGMIPPNAMGMVPMGVNSGGMIVSPPSLGHPPHPFYPSHPPSGSVPSSGVVPPNLIASSSSPPFLPSNSIPGMNPMMPMGMIPQQQMMMGGPPPPQWNKDQVTTAYIGKIALGVEDDFIKKILELCGKVSNWKRPSDPKTGKMKGFGFCEFVNAEGAMTALRILNGLNVGGQALLVKVDEKTQKYLDDLSLQKKAIAASEGGNINEDEINDSNTLNSIRNLIDRRENGLEYKNNNYGERDEEERERRIRMEREREIQRKREREEREFLHSEREWEAREREKSIDREREYEREMERNRRGREREARDLSYDDVERRKRTREYIRRARERKHEFDEDEAERIREIQEEEYRRRDEEMREEERLRRELARENELYQSPLYEPDQPRTPNTDGFLDRTKMTNSVAVQLGASNPVVEKKKIAFVEEEPDTDDIYTKKKLKLTTLDTNLHHENDRKVKMEKVKSVIEQIPTTKEELFAYPINWEIIERNNIVEERMKGWVTKKVVEYLGEEEKVLIDFILKGIRGRTNPVDILKQISVVLDDEGEVFVTKMWQMLIYEMLSSK
eukprot:TRINITY_DN112_c3_g1_i1.p1 TRINITY_DN112_c3_g1~~TRINITY_DN112_c3_g1_i1.p1  ORF type:complete len:635 (+),score=289.52 TRINITY_DN112_c3_g1_i1:1992-3896(+)